MKHFNLTKDSCDRLKKDIQERIEEIALSMRLIHCCPVKVVALTHLRFLLVIQVRSLSSVVCRLQLSGCRAIECLREISDKEETLINYYERLSVFMDSGVDANLHLANELKYCYWRLIDAHRDLSYFRGATRPAPIMAFAE